MVPVRFSAVATSPSTGKAVKIEVEPNLATFLESLEIECKEPDGTSYVNRNQTNK